MKEKLVIKNFGPIKDAEFEFSRFNVLIGEQATGKSTVAKLLGVCRYFSYLVGENEILEIEDSYFLRGLRAWGLDSHVESDSYIFYESNHYSLEAKYSIERYFEDEEGMNEVSFPVFSAILNPISQEFKSLLLDLDNLKPKPKGQYDFSTHFWTIPVTFYQNNVARVMDNPFYLPTERGLQSIFSLGKNSIQNISDSLFNQFARLDQVSKLFKSETEIEPLEIVYKNENGQGFFRKDNHNEFYSLYNAASGYQSIIPIVLLIKYYNELRKKSKTFIIEEPEMNLFPMAQNRLIQYLVESGNAFGNTIFLTTHSPYTLTSLNNMMFAHQIGKIDSEGVNKILAQKYWLDPINVSAYLLKNDGKIESIIDSEGLIKAEKIDSVSQVINEDFNKIFDLEIQKDEES